MFYRGCQPIMIESAVELFDSVGESANSSTHLVKINVWVRALIAKNNVKYNNLLSFYSVSN